MKQDKGVPSPCRTHCRWQLRRRSLCLSPTELLVCPVGLSLLLHLLAPTNAQIVIQTDSFSSPPFTIRCNRLEDEMERINRSCGSQYPILSIEKVSLTFSGTVRELCNHSRYEMDLELNKMLNYLDNTCPKNSEANDDPYRLFPAVQQYTDSYNRHCSPTTILPLTAFAATLNVKCSPARAPARPTTTATPGPTTPVNSKTASTHWFSSSSAPLTPTTITATQTTASVSISTVRTSAANPISSTLAQPVTAPTTATPKATTVAISTAKTIAAITESTSVDKSTESSTTVQRNESEDKIGGMSRDLFIALMAVVGVLVLVFILTIIFVAYRGRRRRLTNEKASVIYPWLNGGGSGEALRLERRDSAFFLGGGGRPNGSIFAPSTIGDADSIRNIRSPSLTPSLLVPFGAESVVALNVNGESRPYVAVPLDAATRAAGAGGRGSRSSSLTGYDAALDSSSLGSVASAPAAASTAKASGLPRYRSLFTRRRSLSAPEELENAAFEHDYDAQAPWNSGGKRGPRTARSVTVSSVGRLESIGEELSSIDSAAAARYDADGGNDYGIDGSRQAASGRRPSQQRPAAGGRRSSRHDKAAASNDGAIRTEPTFDRQAASLQARRMTLPDRLGAYGEAAPASYSSPPPPHLQSMLPRYSADGRSFSQDGASFKETAVAEDDDRSDAESSASVGTPSRWPYASRLRLPRTSWSGVSGGDGGGGDRSLVMPVRKQHGWPGRPTARRQSAL